MSEEYLNDTPVSPTYCPDNELKLLPISLVDSCPRKKSLGIRFSDVSFEDHDLNNETKHVNNISTRCSYDSRCASFSTNERFEIKFFYKKYVIHL